MSSAPCRPSPSTPRHFFPARLVNNALSSELAGLAGCLHRLLEQQPALSTPGEARCRRYGSERERAAGEEGRESATARWASARAGRVLWDTRWQAVQRSSLALVRLRLSAPLLDLVPLFLVEDLPSLRMMLIMIICA